MSQMMIPKWRWAAAVAIAGSALVNVSLILSRQEPIFSRSAVVMIVAYLLPYYLLVRLAVRKPRCGRDAVVRLAGSVSLAVVGILLTRVASSLGIVLLLIGGAVVVEVVARMASHSREGMVWLGWGALSLVVSFFINWAIAPYVHLPKAESYYGAEMPADVRGQLDHFYWIWDSPERVREEQTRMRDQNPEWDLISRAFLGYSLANVALQYPAEREKALEVLDRVIDDTVVVPWRKFLLPYGNERAFVRQPASSIMVDGEVSLMIGLRRLVEDPDDYAHRDVYREQIERCVAAIEDGPLLCAESYPDECWLWCTPLALCSIKIYDLLEGTDSFLTPSGEPVNRSGKDIFAIRFHLHPDIRAIYQPQTRSVILEFPRGERWELEADNGDMRVEESIFTSSYTDCHYCSGRGMVKSPLSMSVEIQRRVNESMRKDRNGTHSMRITVNPTVLDRLRKEDEAALVDLEKKFEGHLTFVSDSHFHMEEFSITNDDNGKVLFTSIEP